MYSLNFYDTNSQNTKIINAELIAKEWFNLIVNSIKITKIKHITPAKIIEFFILFENSLFITYVKKYKLNAK